jgi:NAD-dependent deacetylase
MEELIRHIQSCEGLFLVLTGAGISHASGIPTFRGTDRDAVWKRDVTELGTFGYFSEDPVGSWRWYLQRFEKVIGAQPNPGHSALVDLEKWAHKRNRDYLLVTQNIDGLHRAAGSTELVEVHGSAHRVRCAARGCVYASPKGSLPRDEINLAAFIENPTTATLPRCPACRGVLRQHVLWFDEYYDSHKDYEWAKVLSSAEKAQLILFVGTSFAVGVTELFVQSGRARGVPMYSIDPGGRPMSDIKLIAEPSEVVLPKLAQAVSAC